jgi:AI-2 transport protein TqsA
MRSVRGAVQNAKQYESYVAALARKVTAAQDRLGQSKLGERLDAQNILESQLQDIPIGDIIARLSRWTITGALALLARLTLVIIFVLYLLSPDGGKRQPRAMKNGVWAQIQRRTQKFVSMKLVISSCTGIVCGTVYYVLGVQLWHAFATMHIIFSLIPNVGAIIACLLPIPVVAIDDTMSPMRVLIAFALPTAAHLCVGYFVEPQLLGDCLNLHPVTVLASLAFWGVLWGIPGMLLACPLTSAIRVLLASIEVTQPFAEILSGNVSGAGAYSKVSGAEDAEAEEAIPSQASTAAGTKNHELERVDRERPAHGSPTQNEGQLNGSSLHHHHHHPNRYIGKDAGDAV